MALTHLTEKIEQCGFALLAVLNVTPDSFSDGGLYVSPRVIEGRIDELLAEGADFIDIGAESTRPGSERVSPDLQWERAKGAIEYAVQRGARVSIDTGSPEVAERALGAGVCLVNDVTCLGDERLAQLAKAYGVPLLMMHSRGSMTEMRAFSDYPESAYGDVVADVRAEWCQARDRALAMGLDASALWFDPGFGFHKSATQSLELLRRFEEFRDLSKVIAAGPSRKSFLTQLTTGPVRRGQGSRETEGHMATPPGRRLGATVAACIALFKSGAQLLRVHDVLEVRQALLLSSRLMGEPGSQKAGSSG